MAVECRHVRRDATLYAAEVVVGVNLYLSVTTAQLQTTPCTYECTAETYASGDVLLSARSVR